MLFTSIEFIGFLVLLMVSYYLVPKKMQWPLLLIFSYIFYFIADPRYLLFILVTTVSTFWISIVMENIMLDSKFKTERNILHIDVMDIIIIVVMLQDFPIIN